jgi:hypothetical protein
MAQGAGTLEQKLGEYTSRGVTRVKLGLTDVDGVLRGKYVDLAKFASRWKVTCLPLL